MGRVASTLHFSISRGLMSSSSSSSSSFQLDSHIPSAPSPTKNSTADIPSTKITIHDPTPPVDYKARAQWLRAAVLGANDGLVSVASLMIGVGAVNQTARAMLLSGIAGLVAGACSMAIGEFVSVHTQYDVEVTMQNSVTEVVPKDQESHQLPRPMQAAAASGLAFAVGAVLPLVAGGFIRDWGVRVGVVCGVSSLGLAGFGAAGAALGGTCVRRSALRVLVGGWLAMLITYGVLRLFGVVFKTQMSLA